jgi:hypothetical protein
MNEKPLWSAVASDANAEPVRIIDLDVAKTTWSRVHETMRVVHLRLNRQPDPHWIRFFHEERESRINARRAGIWIEDGYIAFDCLLPDVETHHMPDIRRSVEYANERSLALLASRLRERGAQAAADRSERLELEQLRKRVKDLVDPRATAGRATTAAVAPQASAASKPTPPSAPKPAPASKPAATSNPERTVERGAERRAADRRAAATVPTPTPTKPATASPGRTAPRSEPAAAARPDPVEPPSRVAPTTAPARAPSPAAERATTSEPPATPPRSLEATLDDFRAALREARERAAQPSDDPNDTNR